MPQVNDWVREALKHIQFAIDFLAFEGQGLNERIGHNKQLQMIENYLDHHEETISFANESVHDNFYEALGLMKRINSNDYVNSENRRILKVIQECLREYINESPPVNNPNQLNINFDGENQNRNPQ